MTYEDIVNVLKNQYTDEILSLCNLTEPDDLIKALDEYIDTHQDEIIKNVEENELI